MSKNLTRKTRVVIDANVLDALSAIKPQDSSMTLRINSILTAYINRQNVIQLLKAQSNTNKKETNK